MVVSYATAVLGFLILVAGMSLVMFQVDASGMHLDNVLNAEGSGWKRASDGFLRILAEDPPSRPF